MDIVSRAKNLLREPRMEWQVIAAEPADAMSLFTGYAMILSAIPPIAMFIGLWLVGVPIGGHAMRLGFGFLLGHAIARYVLGLVAIWVVSLIIAFLAPKFGGQANSLTALKLAVYAPTAAWLAGVFALLPVLSILAILGLYSIYTLYVGLPILTGCPQDRAGMFVGAIVLSYIVLAILVGLLAVLV